MLKRGACIRITPGQLVKTVAAIAIPESLTAVDTWVRRFTLYGLKGFRTNNVGNVFLGPTAVDGEQPILIIPGPAGTSEQAIEAPPGCVYNLKDWYIDVLNAGDGVLCVYDAADNTTASS